VEGCFRPYISHYATGPASSLLSTGPGEAEPDAVVIRDAVPWFITRRDGLPREITTLRGGRLFLAINAHRPSGVAHSAPDDIYPPNQEAPKGFTYANLKSTILFNRQSMDIQAWVDTGATFMCVTEAIALQLGFDVTEVSQQTLTLTDGHQRKVSKIAPIEITFANRTYVTEAVVLGDEPLMGVIPLEAMDLVVDSGRQQVMVNPQHPNYPVALAK
jgi:clan AA aspartic protease